MTPNSEMGGICLVKEHSMGPVGRETYPTGEFIQWMRFSRIVRASDSQCRSRNWPGFDPSILRHSEIWGAADEALLNIIQKKKKF